MTPKLSRVLCDADHAFACDVSGERRYALGDNSDIGGARPAIVVEVQDGRGRYVQIIWTM